VLSISLSHKAESAVDSKRQAFRGRILMVSLMGRYQYPSYTVESLEKLKQLWNEKLDLKDSRDARDQATQIVRVITFCVSRRRRKMYSGHARLCVCLSVCLCVCLSAAVRPHYCTDPDVTWRHGRGCPLVVQYWADLQSGHGLRCYGNITRTLVTSLRPSRDMTT